MGHAIVEESARAIIAERVASGLSPRPDPLSFAREILRRDGEKYAAQPDTPRWVFFDRSAIEAIGMLHDASPLARHELEAMLAAYPFHRTVFVLPPWEAIYATDAERDQSFAEAVNVHAIRARIQAYDTAIKPELFTQDAVFWTGAYAHPHRMNEPQAQVAGDNIVAPGRKNSKNVTTVDRITVNGDMAFEYSTFVLTFDDNEGHHTRSGAVLRTWQRQGGVWKIAAQIQRPFGRVEFVDEQPKK